MKRPRNPIKKVFFRRRPVFLLPVIILMLGIIIATACSSTQESATGKIGNPAPDFTLPDLGGNQITLSDLKGKVVFLNFWSTTCGSCKAEMPDMEKLHQEYKDRNVVVISIDLRESQSTVSDFVRENGYSWTFLLDKTGSVSFKYEIKNTPTSFFLDTDGIVRAAKVGPMSLESMESNLNKAIEKG